MKNLKLLFLTLTLVLFISQQVFAEDAFPNGRVRAEGTDPNEEKAKIDSVRGGFQGAVTKKGGATPAGTPLFPGTAPINQDADCALCHNSRSAGTPGDQLDPGFSQTPAEPGAEGVAD